MSRSPLNGHRTLSEDQRREWATIILAAIVLEPGTGQELLKRVGHLLAADVTHLTPDEIELEFGFVIGDLSKSDRSGASKVFWFHKRKMSDGILHPVWEASAGLKLVNGEDPPAAVQVFNELCAEKGLCPDLDVSAEAEKCRLILGALERRRGTTRTGEAPRVLPALALARKFKIRPGGTDDSKKRGVRTLIAKLRSDGVAVLANNDGYFLSIEPADMERYEAHLRRSGLSRFSLAASVSRSTDADANRGQIPLFPTRFREVRPPTRR